MGVSLVRPLTKGLPFAPGDTELLLATRESPAVGR
jgi:hypothetical protein